MKRLSAILVATMLAGQAWAQQPEPVYNEWYCEGADYMGIYPEINYVKTVGGVNTNAMAIEIPEAYEDVEYDTWNCQFDIFLKDNIGQVKDNDFSLSFDVYWESDEEADNAQIYLLFGNEGFNYEGERISIHDFSYTYNPSENTELISPDDFWDIQQKAVTVAKNEWTSVSWGEGIKIGENGKDLIGIRIELAATIDYPQWISNNTGTFYFRNIEIKLGENVLSFFKSAPSHIIPKVLETEGMDDDGVKYLAQDSVIEYELGLPKTKSVFEYDDRYNKTSETVYSWNTETNEWVDSCKFVNTYDADNNRTLIVSYSKNDGNWQNSGKMDLIYDENGNKSLEAYYYWNAETNSWVGDHGTIDFPYYERDLIWDSSKKCWKLTDERFTRYSTSADFLTEYEIYEAYDANIKAWVNSSKIEFEHDGNGNKTLEKKYEWNAETSTWVNYSCTVTNWYPNGYYWSDVFYWNAENAQWQDMETSTDANGKKTIIWSDWKKTEYTYDANGSVILEISSIWNDEENDWEKASKSEYSYDANGNKTLSIFCFWDNEKNDWANYSKREFSYSETKNTETVYRWDAESNGWIGTYKYDYAYKDNIYVTLRANYEWNTETNAWIGDWCYAYWYDADGKSHSAECDWNYSAGQWDLSSGELFQKEYNAAGKKTLELYVAYDANTNTWRDSEKVVYTYNTNGDITRLERFSWNTERNEWISYYYEETSYDAKGKEKLEISYLISNIETNEWIGNCGTAHWYDAEDRRSDISFDWNSEKGQWDLSTSDVLANTEYDAANNKTLELYKAYDANNATWVDSRKIEFAYNGDKTIATTYKWDATATAWVASSKTETTFDENLKNNTVVVEYKWSAEGNTWIGSSKTEYVYAGNKPLEFNYNWNYEENKFEYTAEGLPIQRKNSVWDSETNQWVNANKLVLSDDPDFVFIGKPLYPVYYTWDAESNDWEESTDYVWFNYNYYGNVMASVTYYVNTLLLQFQNDNMFINDYWGYYKNNQWVNSNKDEYLKDENGRTIIESYSGRWDNGTNEWFMPNLSINSFDDNNNEALSITKSQTKKYNQETHQYEWTEPVRGASVYYYDAKGNLVGSTKFSLSENDSAEYVKLDSNLFKIVVKSFDDVQDKWSVSAEHFYTVLVTLEKEINYGEPTYVWSTDNATCTATKVCVDDNTLIVTETVNSTSAVTTAATCEAVGTRTYTAVFTEEGFENQTTTEEIPALGHAEVVDTAVAATCTEAGKTEGKHCSVCKKVIVAQEVVAAKGHAEVVDVAVAATCTEAGKTEGKHCSVCNKVIVAQEIVPAQGHSKGEIVAENLKAATCTSAGSVDSVVYCTICKAEISRKTVEISAPGHKADSIAIENVVAATYVAAGSYDSVVYCSVCRAEISRTKVAVPQLVVPQIDAEVVVSQLEYTIGDNLNLDGGKIVVATSDSTTTEVVITPDMVTGFNPDSVGVQQVTITFEVDGVPYTRTFEVTVKEPEIVVAQSIKISVMPNKVTYKKGEQLDVAGGKLTVTYSNGTTQTVDLKADMIGGFNADKVGTQKLTVTLKVEEVTLTTTFDVAIEDDSTAVAESAANAINIYAHHSTIVVENATEEIRVYDAMGRMIGRDAINRVRTEISVKGTGIYVVKVGNVAKRVMIND